MNKTSQIIRNVKYFSEQGVGVTRQTLSGSTGVPINSVCSIVNGLVRDGALIERGQMGGRSLLWSAA